MELASTFFHFLQYHINLLPVQEPIVPTDLPGHCRADQELGFREAYFIIQQRPACMTGLRTENCLLDGETKAFRHLPGVNGVFIGISRLFLFQNGRLRNTSLN